MPKNYFSRVDLCILIAIILSGFLLYIPALQSTSFYFDDRSSIEENAAIKKMDLPGIFHAFNTRFLVGLSFALNYKFSGLHPAAYRMTNLLIHCLNSFFVYLLLRQTLFLSSQEGRGAWPAIFGTMLFLCHPIQTEPVDFVTQRFVLMASFFYLTSLVFYVKSRRHCEERSDEAIFLEFYYIFSLIAATAAMLCKEIAVTLPLMVALYEFYFLGRLKETAWERCRRLLPFFVIALIVPVLLLRTPPTAVGVASIADSHLNLSATQRTRDHIDITRALGDIGRKQYFLTELNVVCTYVRLLFLPIRQDLDYDYPLSSGLDYKTLLSGIFLFCLLVTAILIFKKNRIISFSIVWFFLALSVESSFIPIGHVIAEYRLYLASVGFVLLITVVLYSRPADVRKLNMIAAVILIVLSILTYQRNMVWKDGFTLWNDVVLKSPHKARGYVNRGVEYARRGNNIQAFSDINKAIAIDPKSSQAYSSRGVIYAEHNDLDQALFDFNKAISLDQFNAEAYSNRSNLYTKRGDFTAALSDLDKSIEINPDYADAYFNRGNVYYRQNNYARAIDDYTKVIEINPQFGKVYPNLVVIYLVLKEFDKAWSFVRKAQEAGCPIDPKLIKLFRESSEIKPEDVQAFNSDGLNDVKHEKFEQAFVAFSKAIEMDHRNAQAYNNRANIYIKRGDFIDALSDLDRSIEINPGFEGSYFNRGDVHYRQNDFAQAIDDYQQVIKLNPLFEKAYTNLIVVYSRLKEFDKARNAVHQAEEAGIHIDPKITETLKALSGINVREAKALNRRGVDDAKHGDLAQALAALNKAIEMDPDFEEAYSNRSNLYALKGDLTKALSDLNRSIAINPAFAKAYYNRGIIDDRQKKSSQAVVDYVKAIELNPRYQKAYVNLIAVYCRLKEFDKARSLMDKAHKAGIIIDSKLIEVPGSSVKDK